MKYDTKQLRLRFSTFKIEIYAQLYLRFGSKNEECKTQKKEEKEEEKTHQTC